MARKNTVPQPPAPTNYRAEFLRIRDRAEEYFVALEMLLGEANELRDELMELHPEVARWSPEQARLENLYGYDLVSDIAEAVGPC